MSAITNNLPHLGQSRSDLEHEADLVITRGDPREITEQALAHAKRPAISTNFRPGAAALLHLVIAQRQDIPVIWVDTGYNTATTYSYIEGLREAWDLNLHVYSPRMTTARRMALSGAIPPSDDVRFPDFVQDTKLEPFERAFSELKPDVWFTGIRREQTAYRASLGVVSRGHGNSWRVAPLYASSQDDVANYLTSHGIADNHHYVDPTKPGEHLECGLQQLT